MRLNSYNLYKYQEISKEIFRCIDRTILSISLPIVALRYVSIEPVTRSQSKNSRSQMQYSVTTLLNQEQQQRINQFRKTGFLE